MQQRGPCYIAIESPDGMKKWSIHPDMATMLRMCLENKTVMQVGYGNEHGFHGSFVLMTSGEAKNVPTLHQASPSSEPMQQQLKKGASWSAQPVQLNVQEDEEEEEEAVEKDEQEEKKEHDPFAFNPKSLSEQQLAYLATVFTKNCEENHKDEKERNACALCHNAYPRRCPFVTADGVIDYKRLRYFPKKCQHEDNCFKGSECHYAHSRTEVDFHPLIWGSVDCEIPNCIGYNNKAHRPCTFHHSKKCTKKNCTGTFVKGKHLCLFVHDK